MRLEERRVAVRDLVEGMYVCRLEREGDWEGTSFLLQGVMVESQEDIDQLDRYCDYVYVDIQLGRAPAEKPKPVKAVVARKEYTPVEIEAMRARVAYVDSASFDDEVPRAMEARGKAAEFATRMLDDVRQGREISTEDVRDAVEPMVRSIVRNADAFLWIDNLRERGDYDYNHALGCSALAAAFGRHIGFPEELLADLAGGGLLLDIGKLRVRPELMDRQGPIGADEHAEIRCHVEHGLEILNNGNVLQSHVRDMIVFHHEREDGSGYQQGLTGDRIPLLARIAGVVDSFDAMTSHRLHKPALAKHTALQELYRERGKLYSAELVEQFMQCLGVYPTGSLVELSTGEVAAVMGQNTARRLRPKLMVLTDPDKTLLQNFRPLDLMMQSEQDDNAVRISMALEAGAYGLDTAELYL